MEDGGGGDVRLLQGGVATGYVQAGGVLHAPAAAKGKGRGGGEGVVERTGEREI